MPPAISDDEMDSDDGVDMVPAKAPPVLKNVEDEVEEEDEDSDGEEYRVEKILKHDFSEEGFTLYQIKWLGYNEKSDLTWEPVENLENALGILKEYHVRIGGTPEYEVPKNKGPKAGSKRSSKAANLDSPQVTSSSKKAKRKSGDVKTANGTTEIEPKDLPEGSWETFVRVSSILEEPAAALKDSKQKHGDVLLALLLWHSGRKTQHTLEVARRKCPQRLLDYYEQHLVFKPKAVDEEEADGAAEDV